MKRKTTVSAAVLLLVFALAPDRVVAQSEPGVRVVSIEGHRKRFDRPAEDAILRYLLIDVTNGDSDGDGTLDFEPLDPVAILALLPGGEGRLRLNPATREHGSPGFPVNSRYHLAAEGFIVAAVDAASDFLDHQHPPRVDGGFWHDAGLTGHRLPNRLYADSHRLDLEAAIGDLRQRYPGLPLWAVAISMGTLTAIVTATELAEPPDGVVLAGPVTGPHRGGDLTDVDLGRVRVPTLIATHQDDQCPSTRPEDAKLLAERLTASPRVEVLVFSGGSPPLRGACNAPSPHTFFGVEQELVEAIADWINQGDPSAAG